MRRALVAAVALAPLCLVLGRGGAAAQDMVTNGVNSPIATATAANGAPADIDITTSGSVTVNTASAAPIADVTPAVTLNSSNSVSNAGSISMTGVNDAAAILAVGGNTGSITNGGTITVTENSSTTNASDGITQEPYATGTGRYGIRLVEPAGGAAPLVGSIENDGTITVTGNASYGISIEAPLTGSLTNLGTISLTGDSGAAIRSTSTGSVSGNVLITGAINALGQNTSDVNLAGDVGGRLSIYSAINGTAYATTTRPTSTGTLNNVQATPTQVEQSAGAVIVGGNVGGGIFIGAPPVGTTTTSTGDLDGDGITDSLEGTGSIVNYGSAPALTVGGSGVTTIGAVGDTIITNGVPVLENAYGLIIRGTVQGIGLYDGFPATGLQIGTGLPNSGVTVDGGVRVVGSVTAQSYEADATAIHIFAGATVPEIRNEDFITSTINHSVVSTTAPTATSSGILIDANASVSRITNIGTIQAQANGDAMSAYAVRDFSGSVSAVDNQGVIAAAVTPVTAAATSGPTYALDLRNNTTGIVLTQEVNPNPIAIEVSTTTNSSGVVSTTAALTTATSTVTTTVTTTTAGVTTTTTTTTPTFPEIIGDVYLGNGTNTVSILGGSVTGALTMGTGANDTFTVGENDANGVHAGLYQGALTYGGDSLALNVVNGSLINTSPTTLNLRSLNVGQLGVLYAAIDPATSQHTLYNVNGTATIGSGGQLGIVLTSPLFNETNYTIVQATNLNNAASGALLLSQVPYVLVGTATTDTAAGTISIDLRRRTAQEMNLNPAETSALNAVYASLPNDAGIQNAALSQYTRGGFLNVYDQLLPDYAGGIFQLSLAASDAVTRATSRVNDIQNPSGTRGAWAEEVAFGVNRDRSSESAGYQGGGFGFVGGVETGGLGLGSFGLTGSFLTGDLRNPHSPGANLGSFSEGEGGVYWQGQLGGLRLDARAGGGYVLFSDRRELLLKDTTGATTLDRSAKGSSSGYTLTGHFGAGYQTTQIGWVYFRPQVRGDYYRLEEGSFSEHNGGSGFDLSLASRTGDQTSGTASLVTGMAFGEGFRWRPELELGYRDVFTGTAGDTTANFAGAAPFTITAPSIKGGGPLGRLDVKADTDFYELNFEAGAEQRSHLTEADLRISVRVLF